MAVGCEIYPISSYSGIIVLSFLICDNRIASVGLLHIRNIYVGLSQGTVLQSFQ